MNARPAMNSKYYTLLIREPDSNWTIHFGDYSRRVVVQERIDIADEGWPRGTLFKIIMTLDRQADIDAKVDELNGVITTRGRANG